MKTAPLILVSGCSEARGAEFDDPSLSLSNRYGAALQSVGAIPWILPPLTRPGHVAEAVRRCDGVMLTGGDDVQPGLYTDSLPEALAKTVRETDPGRDLLEFQLIDAVFSQHKPLLAICRGQQILNVALGGTLLVDIPTQVPGALDHRQSARPDEIVHQATLTKGSILDMIAESGSLGVNSAHHQAVDQVAEPLQVTARSSDGVVEGLELRESDMSLLPFLVAVQFHPERLFHRHKAHKKLFEKFVRQCVAKESKTV